MQNCPLRNKSEMFIASADLLQEQCYFPAVAHAAYYSCYQLLKYIWLYSMGKTQDELDANISQSREGSHEYLLNQVVDYVSKHPNINSGVDARNIRNTMPQLKRLRTDADYNDADFDCNKSKRSIDLSKTLLAILKKY